MKTFKSTARCGYNEYAYVLLLENNNYLCIFSNENSDYPIHKEGEIINIEDIYLEEVDIDITTFPLCKTFLFKYFIDNYFNLKNLSNDI